MKRKKGGNEGKATVFQTKLRHHSSVKARIEACRAARRTMEEQTVAEEVEFEPTRPFTTLDVARIRLGRHELCGPLKAEWEARNKFRRLFGKAFMAALHSADMMQTTSDPSGLATTKTNLVHIGNLVKQLRPMLAKELVRRKEQKYPLCRPSPMAVHKMTRTAWFSSMGRVRESALSLHRTDAAMYAAALAKTLRFQRANRYRVRTGLVTVLDSHQSFVEQRQAGGGGDIDQDALKRATDTELQSLVKHGLISLLPLQDMTKMWLVGHGRDSPQPWDTWLDGSPAPQMFVTTPVALVPKSWMEVHVLHRMCKALHVVGSRINLDAYICKERFSVDALMSLDGSEKLLAVEVEGVLWHMQLSHVRRAPSAEYHPTELRRKDMLRLHAMLEQGFRPCVVFGWKLADVRAVPVGELPVWELVAPNEWKILAHV